MIVGMDVATLNDLLSERGQQLLAEVAAGAGIESDLALGTRLRRTHPPALVAAAVTQNHLRGMAIAKFGDDAARMYFTHDALEQSTRASVSAHRARRLTASGSDRILDLSCGIGGDLIAFAKVGMEVRGVDIDPLRAAIAQANLDALELAGTVSCADATKMSIDATETVFIDPARRDAHGRIFNARNVVPAWEFITSLLTGRAVVKTMPGIAHHLVPEGVEAEWISDGGDLVEASLWGYPFARVDHRATLLPQNATLTESDDRHDILVAAPGDAIYEPDDAVIRAGLVTAVAAQVGGWLIDPHIAYVSSTTPMFTPYARTFRVVEELPYRHKALRAALVERNVGALTIKKRGVDLVPEKAIKAMRLRGAHSATIIMTRVQGEGRAYLVERMPDH